MYEEVLVGVGYLSIYVEVSIWWFFGAVAGGFLGFIVGGFLEWFNSSKRVKIMKKFDAVLLLLVMVVSAGFVRAEDAKEVVVSSAEELKGIKAKKITWKKDGAKMALIPSTAKFRQEKTLNQIIDPITKTVKGEGTYSLTGRAGTAVRSPRCSPSKSTYN